MTDDLTPQEREARTEAAREVVEKMADGLCLASTDHDVCGVALMRHLLVEVDRLTRERDEARADAARGAR